jgi:uncharacterized protein YndB with AHSA1/START domain
MKISPVILLVITLAGIEFASSQNGAPPAAAALMEGKKATDRTIHLDTFVDLSPSEVFQLWTSVDGVKKFFAPEARIDARPGGRYTIIFFPSKDPDGDSHGTKGARVLELVPNRRLAFEWITFAGDEILGHNAPPYAPPAERNVKPLPTWVEINFESVEGQPNKTHVVFAHYGFGDGEKWEKSYRWFGKAWKGVLDRLADYGQKQNSERAGDQATNVKKSIVDLGKF